MNIKKSQLIAVAFLCCISFELQAAMCLLSATPLGSAYINAYNQGRIIPPLGGIVTDLQSRGNFGDAPQSSSSAGDCELTGLASDVAPPSPGFTIITSTSQAIPNTTGAQIGTVTERVWRKLATTAPATSTNMCIIGTETSFAQNVLYDGVNLFELNDIVRGGYAGLGTLNVGYRSDFGDSRAYRIGRTFTSVQHRAESWFGSLSQKQRNGTGYLDLPSIGGMPSISTNGSTTGISSPTQQEAQISDGWVDFTTIAGYSRSRVSSMNYIEFSCGSNVDNAAIINSTWRKAGSLRLRKTAQRNNLFADIVLTGYAPPGAIVSIPTP